jgi:hypothetical protein
MPPAARSFGIPVINHGARREPTPTLPTARIGDVTYRVVCLNPDIALKTYWWTNLDEGVFEHFETETPKFGRPDVTFGVLLSV